MLSPGQMAMFSAYPDTYRMDVYDSSGECVIPADITAISQSNGTMINDNEGFEVANMGQVPFPDPSHPQHYVWNFRILIIFQPIDEFVLTVNVPFVLN